MSARIPFVVELLLVGTMVVSASADQRHVCTPPASGGSRLTLDASEGYENRHALCVGIDDYDSDAFGDMRYAENDAWEMAKLLRDVYGFDHLQVLLGKNATKRMIEAAIVDLCDPGCVGPKDAVVFYFSGHVRTVLSNDAVVACLIPQDADITATDRPDPTPYRQGAIALDGLLRDVGRMSALHVLVLIEAGCDGPSAEARPTGAQTLANAFEHPARQLITAGAANEETVELDEKRHGLFTSRLLEILNTEQQPLRATTLGEMLETQVPRDAESRLSGSRQPVPRLHHISGSGDFVFIRPGIKPKGRQRSHAGAAPPSQDNKVDRFDGFVSKRPAKHGRDRYVNAAGMMFVSITEIAPHCYMGVFEVTNREYRRCKPRHDSGRTTTGKSLNGDNQPVVRVSWTDAAEFCRWLTEHERELAAARGQSTSWTYRLPTSHEWEQACRAGRSSDAMYHFGDDWGKLKDHAWYDHNAEGCSHPVGRLAPNAYGLYDMHGNVWEWCQTQYPDKPDYRIIRGGSWGVTGGWCKADVVNGEKMQNGPMSADEYKGFRVVRVQPPRSKQRE
ncbi:MAG: SUMF1/EgtB/PvdO family nonheme iron enzyme [Planctomycetota bacterium]